MTNLVVQHLSTSTNSFFKRLIINYSDSVYQHMFNTFRNFSSEKWEEFNDFVEDSMDKFEKEMQSLRNSFEDLENILTEETRMSFQNELLFQIKNNLKNSKYKIKDYQIEMFKRKFELKDGTRRNWKVMDDSEIEGLFKESKNFFLKNLKVLDKAIILNFDLEIILPLEECIKLKNSFVDDINDILESAFNKKYNRNSLQRVPKWLWLVLAYFMHDNIIEWMRNPLFFFLLILVSVTFGYLFATGRMHYVRWVLTFAKDQIQRRLFGAARN